MLSHDRSKLAVNENVEKNPRHSQGENHESASRHADDSPRRIEAEPPSLGRHHQRALYSQRRSGRNDHLEGADFLAGGRRS